MNELAREGIRVWQGTGKEGRELEDGSSQARARSHRDLHAVEPDLARGIGAPDDKGSLGNSASLKAYRQLVLVRARHSQHEDCKLVGRDFAHLPDERARDIDRVWPHFARSTELLATDVEIAVGARDDPRPIVSEQRDLAVFERSRFSDPEADVVLARDRGRESNRALDVRLRTPRKARAVSREGLSVFGRLTRAIFVLGGLLAGGNEGVVADRAIDPV